MAGPCLGMAISKKLLDLMGGKIDVESEIGRGSLFSVELQLKKGLGGNEDGPSLTEGQRTLVVDDMEADRLYLCELLNDLGFRTSETSGGQAGLEMLAAADKTGDPYRIVIVDLKMPELDGIDTILMIRSLGLKTEPQIILATAYGNEIFDIDLNKIGVSRVLSKPVSLSTLNDTILELSHKIRGNNAESNKLSEDEINRCAGARILLAEDNKINQDVVVPAT